MKVLLLLSVLKAVTFAEDVKASYVPFPTGFSKNTGLGIINGDEAKINQFPYQISLQLYDGVDDVYNHTCGGAILNERYIVTAAHCTTLVDSSRYRIAAGILSLSEQNTTAQQYIDSMEFINHPLFPGYGAVAPNDISLIQLGEPLKFSKSVQPIALPQKNEVLTGKGFLSGWGITKDKGQVSDHLLYANVPVKPAKDCKKYLDDIYAQYGVESPFDTKLNICSGPAKDFQQGCSGDSGGPYVVNGKLAGIASWVLMPCGGIKDGPTVYTNVAAFVDWINENMKR